MHKKLRYEPILPNSHDWPVVKMHKSQEAFLELVTKRAVEEIITLHADFSTFRKDLTKFLDQEQARLQRNPWKVDSKNDPNFLPEKIKELQKEEIELPKILKEIALYYAKEIAGGFNIWHYRLAQASASYTLNRLLNPMKPQHPLTLAQIRFKLQEQIHILGNMSELRSLGRLGTLVLVPTHCSHFDSVLIWWIIHMLGLPPFMYGAGLNLFNRKFFAYFMNNVGTYKVDRRKKNIAYLSTLKAYSSLALHWKCHSLFYPGGTRSRSGSLESTLKLGLLSTALDAQHINYTAYGSEASKIFIVPVVFNYHFVLEAPFLIREYLMEHRDYVYKPQKDWIDESYKLLKLIKNFATKGSSISVSFGKPMDVLGNEVDATGSSYDTQGNRIDIYTYFKEKSVGRENFEQKIKESTRLLGQRIVASYHKNNCVLSSCLVAFVGWELMRGQYADICLKDFLKLPNSFFVISYPLLEASFAKARKAVLELYKQGSIQVSEDLQQGTIAGMVMHGLANLGSYNDQLPLVRNKNGDITTRDICSLLYYHNRLTGYGLEKCIT